MLFTYCSSELFFQHLRSGQCLFLVVFFLLFIFWRKHCFYFLMWFIRQYRITIYQFLEIWPCSGSLKSIIWLYHAYQRVAVLQHYCLSTLQSFGKLTFIDSGIFNQWLKVYWSCEYLTSNTATDWWFTISSWNPSISWFLIHLKCVVLIVCRITSGIHVLLIYNLKCLILT